MPGISGGGRPTGADPHTMHVTATRFWLALARDCWVAPSDCLHFLVMATATVTITVATVVSWTVWLLSGEQQLEAPQGHAQADMHVF